MQVQDALFDQDVLTVKKPYLVLARKYRPVFLDEIVGQEVLVQTITNALRLNRLPHAMILTGVRGTGKTTLARIIAKIVNCKDPYITSDFIRSCEKCASCVGISRSQNTDLLEMDAASHTGVNDIRGIIDNVHYAPVVSRYKVYIIDEVHMLSISAFNALLKTLEEPPAHTIFIFATTEIQKIPLTILSRCQRFDLRRIKAEQLKNHYARILGEEDINFDARAMDLVVKAADGSVRDGLSIVDQAISLSRGHITTDVVEKMLCINNGQQIIQLFLHIADGDIVSLLDLIRQIYDAGADPIMIVNQLLELIHKISKSNVMNKMSNMDGFESAQLEKIQQLHIPFLSRSWQVLLKGLDDLKKSSMQLQALEMLLIRLCYMSTSVTPEELLAGGVANTDNAQHDMIKSKAAGSDLLRIRDLDHLLLVLYEKNELSLYYKLYNEIGVVSLEHGHLVLNLFKSDARFIKDLSEFLHTITSIQWNIKTVDKIVPTVAEKLTERDELKKKMATENEIVKEVLSNFTGSRIIDIKVSS